FFVGTVPKTEFLRGKLELDQQGYIITNDKMETNIPGVYAAGDVRQKYLRQVITAASDGAIAAVAAEKYLAEEEAFKTQVLDAQLPVVTVFWTPQNERSIKAVSLLEQGMTNFAGAKLVKIDMYRNQLVASRHQVEQVPTVLIFENGQVTKRFDGDFLVEDVLQSISH
ncbi:MAG: FAD-dependent oxidoreductase, partial [Clostridia bacterium]|nr:FAD-dependent oxidoreductase [Clostridia bacterium]